MQKLIDLVRANNSLQFIDPINDTAYSIDDLLMDNFFIGVDKKLVFLYLDNQITSIKYFWNFINSKHCLVLLSVSLNENYKKNLEQIYSPNIIFDINRNDIENYTLQSNCNNLFVSNTTHQHSIHHKIKLLLSTSGTTGSPKFVRLSEENLVANALSIINYLPINSTDVTPLNLPISYSYGLSILTTNSINGGKIICSNIDVLSKEFWTMFAKFEYTSIAGVPFVYEMLDKIGFTKKSYPSLKYFTQAGGKLQDGLVKKFLEFATINSCKFFVMYGQTEATARMSYLPYENLHNKIGSIGKAIMNGQLFLDKDSNELCYKGPNVFGGYVTQLKDLEVFETIDALFTGDVAEQDEDGYFYITGRIKRFVKLFGNRINLDEVESIISKEFSISSKVIGIEDKLLIVFVLADETFDLKALQESISKSLKLHISVIKIKSIEEIPLTATGKIDYSTLTKNYAS